MRKLSGSISALLLCTLTTGSSVFISSPPRGGENEKRDMSARAYFSKGCLAVLRLARRAQGNGSRLSTLYGHTRHCEVTGGQVHTSPAELCPSAWGYEASHIKAATREGSGKTIAYEMQQFHRGGFFVGETALKSSLTHVFLYNVNKIAAQSNNPVQTPLRNFRSRPGARF